MYFYNFYSSSEATQVAPENNNISKSIDLNPLHFQTSWVSKALFFCFCFSLIGLFFNYYIKIYLAQDSYLTLFLFVLCGLLNVILIPVMLQFNQNTMFSYTVIILTYLTLFWINYILLDNIMADENIPESIATLFGPKKTVLLYAIIVASLNMFIGAALLTSLHKLLIFNILSVCIISTIFYVLFYHVQKDSPYYRLLITYFVLKLIIELILIRMMLYLQYKYMTPPETKKQE